MIELLSTYSVATILIIAFALLFAVKEVFEVIDYFRNKAEGRFSKDHQQKDDKKVILDKLNTMQKGIDDLADEQKKINAKLDEQDKTLQMLKDSDKDQLKMMITKEYHHFIQKGWIDDFSMDNLETNYKHYKEEEGNSFIGTLMEELRTLPHSPKEK